LVLFPPRTCFLHLLPLFGFRGRLLLGLLTLAFFFFALTSLRLLLLAFRACLCLARLALAPVDGILELAVGFLPSLLEFVMPLLFELVAELLVRGNQPA
jgi:hypothetical protein